MTFLKKIYQFVDKYIIIVLIFLISLNASLLYWYQRGEVKEMDKPRYHFYFVGQNLVDPFWKEILRGVEDASSKFNVVVEHNAPRFNNPMEELRYLDIAITSKVDGILTHAANNKQTTDLINKGYKIGIPIITMENDNKNSNRHSFIGTNSFVLGQQAAQLMIEATGGVANIAIIVSGDMELDTASQNLKISGFLSTIKEHVGMEVSQIYTSQMGILSAEEITQSIINTKSDIDAIFTASVVDTLGAAQLIVDRNRIGNYTLVGYGDSEIILRYISMGIIYGTVMSDPYQMGYQGVKALIDIKESNYVSSFIDTGVKVITLENLDEYQQEND